MGRRGKVRVARRRGKAREAEGGARGGTGQYKNPRDTTREGTGGRGTVWEGAVSEKRLKKTRGTTDLC